MKWFRWTAITATTAITAFALTSTAGVVPAPATPAPGGVRVPGVEADLDNPLRPNAHADLGSETAGAEAAVVSDYMTLGFGADATGKALGNQASVTFNRRGDKVRICTPQTCVHR